MSGRDPAAWGGAIEIVAVLKAVDPAHRLDALALACDVWVKTNGTLTTEERREEMK